MYREGCVSCLGCFTVFATFSHLSRHQNQVLRLLPLWKRAMMNFKRGFYFNFPKKTVMTLPHPGCPIEGDHSHCQNCQHPLPAIFSTLTPPEADTFEGSRDRPPKTRFVILFRCPLCKGGCMQYPDDVTVTPREEVPN